MSNDIRSYFINNNAEEATRVDKTLASSLPSNDDSEYYMKDTTEYNQRNKHAFREFLKQHEMALRSKTIFKEWKKEKNMRVMQTTIGDYYQNKLKKELEYQRKTRVNRSLSTEKKESCHYHNSQLPSPPKEKRRVRFAKGTRAEQKTFRKRLRSPPRNLIPQCQSRRKCQPPQLASLKMNNDISSGKRLNDEMMTDEQLLGGKEWMYHLALQIAITQSSRADAKESDKEPQTSEIQDETLAGANDYKLTEAEKRTCNDIMKMEEALINLDKDIVSVEKALCQSQQSYELVNAQFNDLRLDVHEL